MKTPLSFAPILLGIWLILWGLVTAPFIHLNFEHSADVLAGLALVTGVVVILKR